MRPTEYRPQQVILSKRDNNNSNETSTIENIERDNEIKSLLAESNPNNNTVDYNNIITGEMLQDMKMIEKKKMNLIIIMIRNNE